MSGQQRTVNESTPRFWTLCKDNNGKDGKVDGGLLSLELFFGFYVY